MPTKKQRYSPADVENWRAKIKVGNIIAYLQAHCLGKKQMSATQVRAAEILLKRALPELQSIEFIGNTDKPVVFTWGNEQAVPQKPEKEEDKTTVH